MPLLWRSLHCYVLANLEQTLRGRRVSACHLIIVPPPQIMSRRMAGYSWMPHHDILPETLCGLFCRSVTLTHERACSVCHKRLGASAFVAYPAERGVSALAHYSCFQAALAEDGAESGGLGGMYAQKRSVRLINAATRVAAGPGQSLVGRFAQGQPTVERMAAAGMT